MNTFERRYDIDWIRVIAIGLLLIYHVAIGFQSWGIMIGFITNEESWSGLWYPMSMLNVWRIPLLFFVSGMGVFFTLKSRNWKQLLKERTLRILVPFIFGSLVIVPVHVWLWQKTLGFPAGYHPNPGHLWFLGNIFAYVLLFLPLFYLVEKYSGTSALDSVKRFLASPFILVLMAATLVAEALIMQPAPYELYAMTWHGFFLGLLAFFWGFCFMLAGSAFWQMLRKETWIFFLAAVALYAWRMAETAPLYRTALESACWILAVFATGSKYLNRPAKALRYLSGAAYPVYILHMIFLSLGSILIFPLAISVYVKFVLVLLLTAGGSLLAYELLVKRVGVLRLVFGLK